MIHGGAMARRAVELVRDGSAVGLGGGYAAGGQSAARAEGAVDELFLAGAPIFVGARAPATLTLVEGMVFRHGGAVRSTGRCGEAITSPGATR